MKRMGFKKFSPVLMAGGSVVLVAAAIATAVPSMLTWTGVAILFVAFGVFGTMAYLAVKP